MARASREKASRRFGVDLGLKGLRQARGKSALSRRPFPPGQHGRRAGRRTRSDYLRQLEEKQKARIFYGIRETELRRYVEQASRGRQSTGETLVQLLERRLDNVLARLGLASTRAQARQFVSHRHVLVDGRPVNVASYLLHTGQEARIKPGSPVEPLVREAIELVATVPPWLELDREQVAGRVLHLPRRDEVDVPFDESLIVEFYSR